MIYEIAEDVKKTLETGSLVLSKYNDRDESRNKEQSPNGHGQPLNHLCAIHYQ